MRLEDHGWTIKQWIYDHEGRLLAVKYQCKVCGATQMVYYPVTSGCGFAAQSVQNVKEWLS